ncbi:tetratricopeptide repeat protein [Candidatus Omnitrophota bacterium]
MKNKIAVFLFICFFIFNLFIVSNIYAQEHEGDVLYYNGVVYDLSLLTIDYRPEFLTYVLQDIDEKLAKQLKGKGESRVHGVMIVADYYVINGAEIRKTPDEKYILFLSELLAEDFLNIPRAVKGLEKLSDSDIRGMDAQVKREEQIDTILDGGEEAFEKKDEKEPWLGGLLKAQSDVIKGATAFFSGFSDSGDIIIREYRKPFNTVFPKDLIKPYSIRARKNEKEINELFEKGDELFLADDLEGALGYYEKAVWVDPQSAEVYSRRALLFTEMEQYDRAIEDLNKVLTLGEQTADIYNTRGDLYVLVNALDLAELDYSKAIEIQPDYAEAYFNRGYVEDQRGDFLRAIDDYTKAIELVPDYVESFSNRGFVYYELEEYEKAEKDFSRAIVIDPNFGEAYANRAMINFFQEEYLDSWFDVEKCVELNVPVDPQFLSSLKEAYPRP